MPKSKPDPAAEALAWAKAHPYKPRVTCSICLLAPEYRAVLDAFHAAGYGPEMKARWLATKGIELTRFQTSHHYLAGHHERKG